MVTIQTSMGDIVISLHHKETPNTVKNFLDYVESGHYENTIFHRVINNFMIQGGGFDINFDLKKTKGSIINEADKAKENAIGTIAMARTQDPHSATCQFFINTNDNAFLNYQAKNNAEWGYCVFGEVTEGMEVVRKISEVITSSENGHQDVPKTRIMIKKIIIN